MKFSYVAMDTSGKEVTGIISAKDQAEAINKIRNKRLFPTRVTNLDTSVNAPEDRTVEFPPLQALQEVMPVETKTAIDTLASSCATMLEALVARGFARSEAMEMTKVFLAQAMAMGSEGQKDS